MIIQTHEYGYSSNYQELFEYLKKWKTAVEQKYSEVNIKGVNRLREFRLFS